MLRFAIPLLLLGGCAATPTDLARRDTQDANDIGQLADRLRGYVPGKPTNCIGPLRSGSVDAYGDTLVYREGARLFRTTTTGGCFGLRRDDIVVTRSPTGQLCRGDIVRTVDRASGFDSGSCTLGDFTPYSRSKRG